MNTTMQCECGQLLVQAMGEETLKTIGGEVVPFRRRTDYLLCPRCLRLYVIQHLRRRQPEAPQFFEEISGVEGEPSTGAPVPLEEQFEQS